MTDKPTDTEIDAFVQVCREKGMRELAIFQAVLDKWGQPAHSGEPVGYLYCGGSYGDELAEWEIVADQLQCDRLNEHHGALGKEAKLLLYTAPQPVELEPLTPEQVEALPMWKRFVGLWPETRREIVRNIEAAHGITKGGQHADT